MGGQPREHWQSKIGFVLATAGSAVGLGNIWRFPTAVGLNGGGAFVLLYLVLIFLVGIPLMIVELTLGRRSQRNVIGTFKVLKPGTPWWATGVLGVAAAFVILSFYSVIAGWSLAYIFKFVFGRFADVAPSAIQAQFDALTGDPVMPLLWHGLFMALTVGVVVSGVAKGIERWSRILMPVLLVLLIVLALRSMTLEGAREGVFWLLRPDFARLDVAAALGALGQVFFSLSLGMGAILTYGSYLSRGENIPGSAVYIALTDVAIAMLAALTIIPAVFAFGLDVEVGPPLIFITLPAVFQSMPLGNLFGSLFFILLSIAALTSAISLLEVVVAYFLDELGWKRAAAAVLGGSSIFLLGIPASLSRGIWSGVRLFGLTALDLADYVSSNILLPLGGLLTVVFLGWAWGTQRALREIRRDDTPFVLGGVWAFMVRWLAPLVMAYILISGLWNP